MKAHRTLYKVAGAIKGAVPLQEALTVYDCRELRAGFRAWEFDIRLSDGVFSNTIASWELASEFIPDVDRYPEI